MIVLFRREMASYLWSPLGWAVLSLFLLVQGYGFYLLLALVQQPNAPHQAVMQLFFGGTLLYWLFVIVIVSLITMRLIAEERRSGTLEALLTAPVSEDAVVLGKYAAAVAFYGLLWLPTAVYVCIVWRATEDLGLDWGPILAGYFGTMLIGAACISVGTLCSVVARGQVVAGLLTFTILAMLLLVPPLADLTQNPVLERTLQYVSLFGQMDDFTRGIVDTRWITFHVSLIVFCLILAIQALKRRKWA